MSVLEMLDQSSTGAACVCVRDVGPVRLQVRLVSVLEMLDQSSTGAACVCCRQLQRMGTGMFLAVLSFIIAGFVQLQIQVCNYCHPVCSLAIKCVAIIIKCNLSYICIMCAIICVKFGQIYEYKKQCCIFEALC